MAYEHKEGQGSLFKNEKQNDRQPDYRGTIMIGGVTYEIAAWERTSQKGLNYFSLQASQPREQSGFQQSQYRGQSSTPRYPQPSAPQMVPPPVEEDLSSTGDLLEDLPF